MIPVLSEHLRNNLQSVKNLILSEVNIKEIEFLTDASDILIKRIKPNFKTLGPKYGKLMKQIAAIIASFNQKDISHIENEGRIHLTVEGTPVEILLEDVEISTEDIPGWVLLTQNNLTVALDITITEQLRQEGLARELVNRIQNLRKEKDFEVTDKIHVKVEKNTELDKSIRGNFDYICSETLAESLDLIDEIPGEDKKLIDLTEDIRTFVSIEKAI